MLNLMLRYLIGTKNMYPCKSNRIFFSSRKIIGKRLPGHGQKLSGWYGGGIVGFMLNRNTDLLILHLRWPVVISFLI